MGKELQNRGHEAVFLARDTNVADVIRHHFPEVSKDRLVVLRELEVTSDKTVDNCLERENAYQESFAMICSQDRGLGKGYLLNAPGHPQVFKAWWGKEKKYSQVLQEFLRYECALDYLAPDMVMGIAIPKVANLICRKRGIPVRIITPPRFGSLYRWTSDEFESCPKLNEALLNKVDAMQRADVLPEIEYEQTSFAEYFFAQKNYSYTSAISTALYQVIRESYQLIRGTHKCFSEGYSFLGWNGSILRKPRIFNYFLKYGVIPKDLSGSQFLLFPLQMEPESSLLNLSPELNNSIELITWISKSLPADMYVVVKEQPDSFGIRNRLYYDNLRRMANVMIAHPQIHGREWISSCCLVATITGTMGFEAVASQKPVLSFGKHQVINLLPTVEYADSFDTTRKALKTLLTKGSEKENLLKKSSAALDFANKEVCFDLSGYEKIFKSKELHMKLAQTALENLSSELLGEPV